MTNRKKNKDKMIFLLRGIQIKKEKIVFDTVDDLYDYFNIKI
jgi:hypothetical protein